MKCTRNLGKLTVSVEATSVQRSLRSVLPSQPAGWTVRDKGDDDDDGGGNFDGDGDGDGDVRGNWARMIVQHDFETLRHSILILSGLRAVIALVGFASASPTRTLPFPLSLRTSHPTRSKRSI